MNDLQHTGQEFGPNATPTLVSGRSTRARLAILKALDDIGASAGASRIVEMLGGSGVQLQARAVRFHLSKMDQAGLTRSIAKNEGRLITASGRKELARGSVMSKIGLIASRMDELSYRMSLDTENGHGSVVSNVAAISKKDLSRSLYNMKPVFASKLSMGDRIALRMPGERLGEREVPRGKILFSTVCSVTINGAFLKAGIPVFSRFGGLIEMDDGNPKRFVELTEYRGTSIDPHKVFIMANMTKVGKCATTGSGIICASFREVPSIALEKTQKLIAALDRLHLNGVLAIGQPNRPLLDIPVGEGRTGIITIDGLNPIAVLQEAGIPVELYPLSGLEELENFVSFGEIAPMGQRSTYVD
ncbi:MAG: NrpR regulatory domain-containing protein [Chitinivibrionales bacterium]|nr:NrpR regulatory domain-containing protein [Chitinivibrionales bacterium]